MSESHTLTSLEDALLISNEVLIFYNIFYLSLGSPQFKSSPGLCYSIRIGIGNITEHYSSDYLNNAKIYLHEPNEFLYFWEQNSMPNAIKIDLGSLRYLAFYL